MCLFKFIAVKEFVKIENRKATKLNTIKYRYSKQNPAYNDFLATSQVIRYNWVIV